jgi:hypothetical protein
MGSSFGVNAGSWEGMETMKFFCNGMVPNILHGDIHKTYYHIEQLCNELALCCKI